MLTNAKRHALPGLVLLVVLAAADASLALPPGLTRAEKVGLSKVAAEWVRLGSWCASRKLAAQAATCLEQAEAADPHARGLDDLKAEIGAVEGEPSARDLATWERKRASAGRKIASLYERLYASGARVEDPRDQARFETYLWSALEASPSSGRWRKILALVTAACSGKETDKGVRLANRALALGPPKRYVSPLRAAIETAAVDGLVLMTATTHPLRYYLSLPKAWKRNRGRRWPVLLCVDGAGSGFAGIARGYKNRRGDLPFIVVSPCTFSNTNEIKGNLRKKYAKIYAEETIEEGNQGRLDWDEAGVLAVLEDMKTSFDAEERVYVTGFSGGGNVTYMMIFKHPDLVAGAAPACANFMNRNYHELGDSFSEADRTFPLHIITGASDPHRQYTHGNKNSPGIEPQTDAAVKVLEHLGYPGWKRTMIEGMGHSPAHKHVIETFRPWWEGRKKRSDPLDG